MSGTEGDAINYGQRLLTSEGRYTSTLGPLWAFGKKKTREAGLFSDSAGQTK
jgi:hypothetical protein